MNQLLLILCIQILLPSTVVILLHSSLWDVTPWFVISMVSRLTLFVTSRKLNSVPKPHVAAYGRKSLLNVRPGRRSDHDRTAFTDLFFMEARPFCQPVGRAISLQCPNEGQGSKNIENQCPIATKTENQDQRNFPTRSDVPQHADLAMTTDTAPPLSHMLPLPQF